MRQLNTQNSRKAFDLRIFLRIKSLTESLTEVKDKFTLTEVKDLTQEKIHQTLYMTSAADWWNIIGFSPYTQITQHAESQQSPSFHATRVMCIKHCIQYRLQLQKQTNKRLCHIAPDDNVLYLVYMVYCWDNVVQLVQKCESVRCAVRAHIGMTVEDPILCNGSTNVDVTLLILPWDTDYSPMANVTSATTSFGKVSLVIYVY